MLNDAQHNIMWVRETESESERECVREKERKKERMNEWKKERNASLMWEKVELININILFVCYPVSKIRHIRLIFLFSFYIW